MIYELIDIRANPLDRETVVVKTKDPANWEQVLDITKAIRRKMIELMDLARESIPGDMEVRISSMPPEDGGRGCVFHVQSDMNAMLRPLFEGIVWSCIFAELGDELN
jgi:hypothetical protein